MRRRLGPGETCRLSCGESPGANHEGESGGGLTLDLPNRVGVDQEVHVSAVSAVSAVDFAFLYPESCGGGLRQRLLASTESPLLRVLAYPLRQSS